MLIVNALTQPLLPTFASFLWSSSQLNQTSSSRPGTSAAGFLSYAQHIPTPSAIQMSRKRNMLPMTKKTTELCKGAKNENYLEKLNLDTSVVSLKHV